MRLFFADGCPYAHRTRALLTLLGASFESRSVDLANKPADFLALSPTGAVPLLDDEGFVLYESAVINEYLAERFGWKGAYASELRQRARERLAMRRWDDAVLPGAIASFKDPASLASKPQWRKEVEQLAATVAQSQPESLLGLHLATHWIRFSRAFPESEAIQVLQQQVGPFLAAAGALPSVVATNPDFDGVVRFLRARFGPPAAS